jgi:hypothetical protein
MPIWQKNNSSKDDATSYVGILSRLNPASGLGSEHGNKGKATQRQDCCMILQHGFATRPAIRAALQNPVTRLDLPGSTSLTSMDCSVDVYGQV